MTQDPELERLRLRVVQLESELSATDHSGAAALTRSRSRWRSVLSAILVTVACLLAPLSIVAVWADTQLSDTDAFVATMAPLAEDPAVQAALANELTAVVLEYADVEEVTDQLLTAIADRPNVPDRLAGALPALRVPIVSGIENYVRAEVASFLGSPQFAQVWVEANTVAHAQVVDLLEGTQGGALSAQDDSITINLGPIVEQLKQRLVGRGFTVAERIPAVDRSFVLVQSESIGQAQGFYRLLNIVGVWLPIVALLFFGLGVFLARDRRRALIRGSIGVVVAVLALGVSLALARSAYANAAVLLPADAAAGVFDTLVRFLRSGLRATAVAGILVALVAFLLGPSRAAARTRRALEGGIGSLSATAEDAGLQTGGFGTWVHAHKNALWIAIAIGAGLLLAFWNQPTAAVVLWVALVALLLVGVVEFLGRPPASPAAEPSPAQSRSASPTVAMSSGADVPDVSAQSQTRPVDPQP